MQKNTNLAYDSRDARQLESVRQQQAAKQPEIGQVAKTHALPRRQVIKAGICMAYVVGLCAVLIMGKVQLTEANHALQDAQAAYTEVQSEQARLDSTLSSMVSLKTVEERAKELGLNEVKQSQIDYVVVSHDNTVEVIEEDNSIGGKLADLYYQIKEYIFG